MVFEQLEISMKNKMTSPLFHSTCKNYLGYNHRPNVKARTIKILIETVGLYPQELGVGKDFFFQVWMSVFILNQNQNQNKL